MGVPRRLVSTPLSLPDKRLTLTASIFETTQPNTYYTMAKGSGSKKAKKSGSNVFALFSQRQIQEFKEAFGIMDADKDGLLSSSDLVAAFAGVGKSVSDGEASGMLSEAPGPVNFTQMVMLFAEKMAGGADDDDTILKAFDSFEINGKIDAEMFRHSLCTFGDKFTASEVDNAYSEFIIEDGMIDAAYLKGLMVSKRRKEKNKYNLTFLDTIYQPCQAAYSRLLLSQYIIYYILLLYMCHLNY